MVTVFPIKEGKIGKKDRTEEDLIVLYMDHQSHGELVLAFCLAIAGLDRSEVWSPLELFTYFSEILSNCVAVDQ